MRLQSIRAAAIAVIVLASLPCTAATLRVPSEYATIQAGIDAATFGDSVLVASGTYTAFETRAVRPGYSLTSCAFLKDGVVVKSERGSAVTTIDPRNIVGPGPVAVVAQYLASSSTALEGFRMVGPRAYGAFANHCGNVTFRDCRFDDFDGGRGSSGSFSFGGNVTLIACVFANCRAAIGGAIYGGSGELKMSDCTVQNCGNVAVYVDQAPGAPTTSATITDCEFLDNWSDGGGSGAMVVATALGQTTIRNCLFIGNTNLTGGGSGGIGLGRGPKTVEDCVFIQNGSLARGSALKGGAGPYPFLVRRNTFIDNYTIDNSQYNGTVYVEPCNFENNIVVGARGSSAYVISTFSPPRFQACNVFWDNEHGVGAPMTPTDRVVDPDFCDRVALDLTLRAGSPCLPEDPLGCGQIGAFGLGCGTVSLNPTSWGRLKAAYRQ